MASVYFDPILGGDGSTVTDDGNPTTGLANGGHRIRFVPALANTVSIANFTNIKAALAKDYAENTSGIVETGTYSAKAWAITTDSALGTEYSAKEWATGVFVPAGSSKEWATQTDIPVSGGEYSAKEYASGNVVPSGSAKEWATQTGSVVDSTEYSAKEYAVGVAVPVGSAKEWATQTGVAVSGGEYSAKEYAIGIAIPTGSAKEWATQTGVAVDNTEYSAKEYAVGNAVPTGSAKEWASQTGIVADGLKSAKGYAEDSYQSSLTALNAPGTNATSTTSNTLGTGTRTFIIQVDKAYVAGMFLLIAYTPDPTNYFIAQITTYDSLTGELVVNVLQFNGTGTFSDWTFSITAVSANNATTVASTDEDLTYYPVLAAGTGAQSLRIDNVTTPFSYNPNTGLVNFTHLSATSVSSSDISAISSLKIPSGNDDTRPLMPAIGSIRHNTIRGIEYYSGTQWLNVSITPDFILINSGII